MPRKAPATVNPRKGAKGNLPIYTSYIITVNPNKQPSDELQEELQEALNRVVEADGFETRFFSLKRGTGAIECLGVSGTLEVGNVMNRLHAHLVLDFRHPRGTQLYMDYTGFRNALKEELGPGVYLNIKPKHNDFLQRQNYLEKTQLGA